MVYTERTAVFKTAKTKIREERFDSALECCEVTKKRSITDGRFHNTRNKHLSESWDGVSSYEEALKLLCDGYKPVVEELKKRIDLTAERKTVKNEQYLSVVGFQPVVPLYLIGSPVNMINVRKLRPNSPVVNIYYDMGANCGYRPQNFIEAGEKMIRTILALESQGFKINLFVVQGFADKNTSRENNTVDLLTMKIKDSSQAFDLNRMSYAMAHASFFRVIGFDWYERAPHATYRSSYGYPFGQAMADGLSEMSRQIFPDGIFFNCTSILRESESAIEEEIKKYNLKNKAES